ARLDARQQLGELVYGQLRDQALDVRVPRVQALDVGQHHELARAERDGERGGGGIRVEVVQHAVGVGRDGRHHRDAPGRDEVADRVDVDVRDVADESHVHGFTVHIGRSPYRGEQPGILAGHADRVRPVL